MTINKVVFIICSAKLLFTVRARGKQDKPRVKYVKALVRRKRNVCTHQPCCDSDKREFETPDVALLDPMSRPVPSSLLPSKCWCFRSLHSHCCTRFTCVECGRTYRRNVDLSSKNTCFLIKDHDIRYMYVYWNCMWNNLI